MGPPMKTSRWNAGGGRNAAAMTRSTGERAWSVCGLLLALSMIAGVLAGCTTTGGAGGAFCDVARVMHPTERDVEVISNRLVNDVLSHNKHGERSCGWRP
ncbi:hypothetical protein [Devosia nitrariae]|uniref:Lipoprotein n=1 Tax=Devosia nitrariae TaxID=2071872 RepID=A0ABQ5W0K1_9HYPH|nr:hypothetical protein [Devosia nitrariae]GLQ53582.1 hypothetical protein GCM10010862_08410 [Devosia nitrariae]